MVLRERLIPWCALSNCLIVIEEPRNTTASAAVLPTVPCTQHIVVYLNPDESLKLFPSNVLYSHTEKHIFQSEAFCNPSLKHFFQA